MKDKHKHRLQGVVFGILIVLVAIWMLARVTVNGLVVKKSVIDEWVEGREESRRNQAEQESENAQRKFNQIWEAERRRQAEEKRRKENHSQ